MLDQTPKIPDYEIISPLGSGTSGQVWLAKDRFGERRAIKVTHIDYVNSKDYQRRFRREVKAQQQLYAVSSHVARIFDYNEKHIPPYIVMDYINGMDLNRMIALGEMDDIDLQTRLHWIEALASTLTKAHAIKIAGDTHGIIHRDIKPQNIRIQGQRPYLLDFSISLTSDVEIDSTQDAMTLRYVAPEVNASEASDIFSFGLVAFEILYEIHPISTYDEASKIMMSDYIPYVEEKLRNNNWRSPSSIDSKFEELNLEQNRRRLDMIFHRVLSVEPAYRYKTPKQFSDALLSVLLGPSNSYEFQVYQSKNTTETPQVSIEIDNSDLLSQSRHPVDNGNGYVIPNASTSEDTRQFPTEEMEAWAASQDTRQFSDDELASSSPPGEPPEIVQPIDDNDDAEPQAVVTPEPIPPILPPKPKEEPSKRSPSFYILTIISVLIFLIAILSLNNFNAPENELANASDLTQTPVDLTTQSVTDDDGSDTIIASISSTATSTVTDTITPSVTATESVTPTSSATSTNSPTATQTDTPSQTPTITATQTYTPSSTVTKTQTFTPSPTQTFTKTVTVTATKTPTRAHTATRTPTPQAGQVNQRLLTLAGVNTVVAGIFMPADCIDTDSGETLCLEQSIWMDLDPISNATYALCVREGVCSRPAFGEIYDPAGAGANNPVVGVNLRMANTYCAWRDARLPNSNEWQVLMAYTTDAYNNLNEWVQDLDAPQGQSLVYSLTELEPSGVWLEDLYLGEDLTFRCAQPE